MSITFKSKATGDLVMVSAHATPLLHALGKDPDQPGILEVAHMPAALATLQALPDEDPDSQGHGLDDEAREIVQDQFVSLRKRAWPLVQMIQRAHGAQEPVVWGV